MWGWLILALVLLVIAGVVALIIWASKGKGTSSNGGSHHAHPAGGGGDHKGEHKGEYKEHKEILDLQAAVTALQVKKSMMVGATDAKDRDGGTVKILVWNPLKYEERGAGEWLASFSPVDGALTGWAVPKTGMYRISYSTSMVSQYAVAMVVKNDQIALRSIARAADLDATTGNFIAVLESDFLINLLPGDVIQLVIIDMSLGTGTLPFITDSTLTMQLEDDSGLTVDSGADLSPVSFGPLAMAAQTAAAARPTAAALASFTAPQTPAQVAALSMLKSKAGTVGGKGLVETLILVNTLLTLVNATRQAWLGATTPPARVGVVASSSAALTALANKPPTTIPTPPLLIQSPPVTVAPPFALAPISAQPASR